MTFTPISITDLIKRPHSIQEIIDKGESLTVFSRSKPVFNIVPLNPATTKKSVKAKKKLNLPVISVKVNGKLDRESIYNSDSWLDK
jgi:antitoxin (DNA-binding transcriptional repressor) of toxin-antitoxin stability system